MPKSTNWIEIKNEYINTSTSYNKLSQKHGVSLTTLTKRAVRENWTQLREKQYSKMTAKVQQKTAEKLARQEARRMSRMYNALDRLLDKLEEGTENLNKHEITSIKKVTVKEDDGEETTHEEKVFMSQEGNFSVKELRTLTATLKDIQAISQRGKEKSSTGGGNGLEEFLNGVEGDEY